jgi:hypothetical protein
MLRLGNLLHPSGYVRTGSDLNKHDLILTDGEKVGKPEQVMAAFCEVVVMLNNSHGIALVA